MLIGEWIFDHEIDVIVDEICFSSCANYIFTAGKNKIIEKDAIVGWHGSEQQDPFIAAGYGISMEEHYRPQTMTRCRNEAPSCQAKPKRNSSKA